MSSLKFYKQLNESLALVKADFDAANKKSGSRVDFDKEKQHLMDRIDSTSQQELSLSQTPLDTIIESFLDVAVFGLSINPKLELAFLITKVSNQGVLITMFYIGYKGYLQLAIRSKQIKILTVDVIYEKDNFVFHGTREKVIHTTKSLSTTLRGKAAGGYCTTETKDGSIITTVMHPEEMFEIECVARANPNSVWNSPFIDELRKKTLIIRHWKTLIMVASDLFEDTFVERLNSIAENNETVHNQSTGV